MLFSLLNMLWATLYLESWKRYSAELAYHWGTLDSQSELLTEPRPQFTVSAALVHCSLSESTAHFARTDSCLLLPHTLKGSPAFSMARNKRSAWFIFRPPV